MIGLLNFSISDANRDTIVAYGAVPDIVDMLREGRLEARKNATAILINLSGIYKNQAFISDAYSFFRLCLDHGNIETRDVVPMLIELLVSKPVGGIEDAVLSFLAILATHPPGDLAIAKAEEAVAVLVEVLGSGSPDNKEHAAAVLVEACSADDKCLVKAQEHGVMEKLMDLLQNGTDRGKRKAQQLLEDIHDHPLPPTKY